MKSSCFLVSPHVKVEMVNQPIVAGTKEVGAVQCIANAGELRRLQRIVKTFISKVFVDDALEMLYSDFFYFFFSVF